MLDAVHNILLYPTGHNVLSRLVQEDMPLELGTHVNYRRTDHRFLIYLFALHLCLVTAFSEQLPSCGSFRRDSTRASWKLDAQTMCLAPVAWHRAETFPRLQRNWPLPADSPPEDGREGLLRVSVCVRRGGRRALPRSLRRGSRAGRWRRAPSGGGGGQQGAV